MDVQIGAEILRLCKLSIWNDRDFKDLSDELKKDFALSLFIAVTKDKMSDKIQRFKQENIKEINK